LLLKIETGEVEIGDYVSVVGHETISGYIVTKCNASDGNKYALLRDVDNWQTELFTGIEPLTNRTPVFTPIG
jgi:murein tripeptide amidase MpaA